MSHPRLPFSSPARQPTRNLTSACSVERSATPERAARFPVFWRATHPVLRPPRIWDWRGSLLTHGQAHPHRIRTQRVCIPFSIATRHRAIRHKERLPDFNQFHSRPTMPNKTGSILKQTHNMSRRYHDSSSPFQQGCPRKQGRQASQEIGQRARVRTSPVKWFVPDR